MADTVFADTINIMLQINFLPFPRVLFLWACLLLLPYLRWTIPLTTMRWQTMAKAFHLSHTIHHLPPPPPFYNLDYEVSYSSFHVSIVQHQGRIPTSMHCYWFVARVVMAVVLLVGVAKRTVLEIHSHVVHQYEIRPAWHRHLGRERRR
jgi:hypothetical protein